jgi:PAS domain S-box-containing protein
MGYVSPAFEKIWGRTSRELYQNPQLWREAVHPEDRERTLRLLENPERSFSYDEEYRIVQPAGAVRWIRERAFPVRDSTGKVVRIVGIAEDITDRRRLEREILEVSDREQARIGQDLHDSLCQKLVSLAFDTHSMAERLAARSAPETETARQMTRLLDDLITEARSVARGLFPVQLESDGLGAALEQLASTVTTRLKVDCRLDCGAPVPLGDNATATHLYRIAQEAVSNAVKHSRANRIVIHLSAQRGQVELRIVDNGIGLAALPARRAGMGLHTMEYRARTIGGTLSVEARPDGGTGVICLAPQPSERSRL